MMYEEKDKLAELNEQWRQLAADAGKDEDEEEQIDDPPTLTKILESFYADNYAYVVKKQILRSVKEALAAKVRLQAGESSTARFTKNQKQSIQKSIAKHFDFKSANEQFDEHVRNNERKIFGEFTAGQQLRFDVMKLKKKAGRLQATVDNAE